MSSNVQFVYGVCVCVCVCVCKGVCGMEVEGQHRNFFLTNESVNIGC